jgi:acetyl-CoA decarbonylase/synthase complex subunit gamma
VLDTKGINVWCAAGKGTFSTGELVQRIFVTRLSGLVTHRKLILPQLGAPGVAAHEVRKATGFTVRYGPVRAADLPRFLDSDLKATAEMRRVTFSTGDRIALAPVELLSWGKWGVLIAVVLGVLSGFGRDIFSVERALWNMLGAAIPILGGLAAGAVITPWLLPWLPGRAFASKGAWAGALLMIAYLLVFNLVALEPNGWIDWTAWGLLVIAAASFVGMNFTGASTYTSLSGVRKEMRTAVPIQACVAVAGLGFWLVGRYL